MRSKYNKHLHQKSSFLPMLCSKPSIKDVALPKWSDVRSSSFSAGEPLSPKVGCMGQVKRNNRVAGFPTPFHRFTGAGTGKTTDDNTIKYFKLKKLFSSKNLLTPTSTAAATTASSSSSGRGEMIIDGPNSISVVDLDPPLPVIKRVRKLNEGGDAGNLWKRRSGGVALKSLQVQQIQLPNNLYSQACSV